MARSDTDTSAPYWPAWLSATYADSGTPVQYQLTTAGEAVLDRELEAG